MVARNRDIAINRAKTRKALKPRREPYWLNVAEGGYLGYRKMESGSETWIARWRTPESRVT